MKTKLVLWGRDNEENRILVALELRPKDSMINIWTFPHEVATEELQKKLMYEWRDGKEVEFPEGVTSSERSLNAAESLLPDDIKVDKTDIIHRAQTEWQFAVLSSRLNEAYQAEVTQLKEKVAKLTAYDQGMWDELKTFWGKVQEQTRERNLFREHATELRNATNEVFGKLKELRSVLDQEFHAVAKENYDKFAAMLDRVEARIAKGGNLYPVFEDLKHLQRRFRDSKLTREFRNQIWERLDKAFKAVKTKRSGGGTPEDRHSRRLQGLDGALKKMQQSIKRDYEDLEFQKRKIASSSVGQLETQIREAKVKMITERINSKEEKLQEMARTKVDLEDKLASIAAKEAAAAAKQAEVQANKEKARLAKEAADQRKAAEKAAAAALVVETPVVEEVVTPVVEAVEEVVTPVVETVEEVVAPVVEAIEEVVTPVVETPVDETEVVAETKDTPQE